MTDSATGDAAGGTQYRGYQGPDAYAHVGGGSDTEAVERLLRDHPQLTRIVRLDGDGEVEIWAGRAPD